MAKTKKFFYFLLFVILSFTVMASLNLLPISNVSILAYNKTGGLIDNQTTDANGNTTVELIEYVNNGGTRTYYSNYTINATKDGWSVGSVSINLTNNTSVQFLLSDIFSPEKVEIDHPQGIYYPTNISFSLNYSVDDYGLGINSCWFFILNSSNDYEISNTTLTSCTNTTFNVSDEMTYTLYLYANDSANNINYSSVTFGVSTVKPSVVLDYPANDSWYSSIPTNTYFNYTATDSSGLSECQLWGNWTGTWHKNYTWIEPTNATMNYTIVNITEGRYNWNVWCNDTLNNENFALNNRTFGIDVTYPIVTIGTISTSQGSQTISFQHNETDTFLNSCKYSIFDSTGNIDGLNNNVSISCNLARSATVTAYGTYNLTVYANDSAGNENSSTKSFTTIPSASASGGILQLLGVSQLLIASNYSISTTNLGNILDFILAKDSVRPREREFLLINRGSEPVTIELYCDTSFLNQTNELDINISEYKTEEDICNYVYFDKSTLTVSPNELEPSVGKITVYTPQNASFGDKYLYNILAVQRVGDEEALYSKLSISNRVPLWGVVLKWSEWFGQQEKPREEKLAYPVFLVSLVISVVVFLLVLGIFIFFRKEEQRLPLAGFMTAFVSMFILMISLLFTL